MNKYTYLLAVTTLLAAACADSNETEKPQAEAVERAAPMSKEDRLAMRQKLMEERSVERVPVVKDDKLVTSGVIGEVPDDLLDKIYADLEQKSKVNRSEFTLLTAESVQWSDGSLGCPEPGQMYTQAIVDGYRVVIEHAGQTYDYHASAKGYFKICSGFRISREQNPAM